MTTLGGVPPSSRRIILAGATGLVGGHLLSGLLADDSVAEVQVLSRRPLDDTRLTRGEIRFLMISSRLPFVLLFVLFVVALTASAASQPKLQHVEQLARGENDRPLDFYGRVIDQNGEPVAGCKVLGRTLLILGFDRSGGESHYTETDTQGRFQFLGIRGASLTVTPGKPGYEYDSRIPPKWSDDYKPDAAHPMVFTVWKLKGPEPMLHARVTRRLPYDEPSAAFCASFDLATGKIADSGQLHIAIIQSPVVVKRYSGDFTWKIVITVPGGSLVEATDLYKNMAPETGYQAAFSFVQEKGGANWIGKFVKTFYVHTAKGEYAKVTIDLTPGSNRPDLGLGVGLDLETWLNPSGSRNLEFLKGG